MPYLVPFVLPWPFSGLFDGFLVFLRKHRFLPSNKVTMDVSEALEPRGIEPESVKEAIQVRTNSAQFIHIFSAKLPFGFRRKWKKKPLADWEEGFGEDTMEISPKP